MATITLSASVSINGAVGMGTKQAGFLASSTHPLKYASAGPRIAQFNGLRMRRPQVQRSALKLGRAGSASLNITCVSAQPETLVKVQEIIAKQLSIENETVKPDTKFADLGADSLDTVEIVMALEEQFGVSIAEDGAQNIATVQDAADLIENVKAADV